MEEVLGIKAERLTPVSSQLSGFVVAVVVVFLAVLFYQSLRQFILHPKSDKS